MADEDLLKIFLSLKKILRAHAKSLEVATDGPRDYSLNTKRLWKGKPLFFGAANVRKHYVSYHLMPVYACPDLLQGMSPALRKRMQGKACFNFKTPDPALFAELAELTRKGLRRFRTLKLPG
jgi:hypothetical protein